jgi:hypothetical protein
MITVQTDWHKKLRHGSCHAVSYHWIPDISYSTMRRNWNSQLLCNWTQYVNPSGLFLIRFRSVIMNLNTVCHKFKFQILIRQQERRLHRVSVAFRSLATIINCRLGRLLIALAAVNYAISLRRRRFFLQTAHEGGLNRLRHTDQHLLFNSGADERWHHDNWNTGSTNSLWIVVPHFRVAPKSPFKFSARQTINDWFVQHW